MGIFGGYGRGGGGMRITWVLAAVIALFGVIKYFTSTQKNPVTGEAQRVGLSPSQEVALGLRTAPELANQMGGAIPETRDPRAQLVEEVGQKLVEQVRKEAPDMPWKFDFHLLNDPKLVNAFALPGGQCFITTALLDRMDNEAQLAGVLGHEIGHVIHRHSAQQMAKSNLGQSLVTAIGVGASGDGGGYTAAQVAQMANQFLQLSYGREHELQSDRYGVRYMAKAGYDPNEMIGVMEILKKASGGGGGGPEFTKTHPDPGNRAAQIREQIKSEFPNGLPNVSKGRSLRDLRSGSMRSGGDGRPGAPTRSGKTPW
jgi:predicted Zn-dependent protease